MNISTTPTGTVGGTITGGTPAPLLPDQLGRLVAQQRREIERLLLIQRAERTLRQKRTGRLGTGDLGLGISDFRKIPSPQSSIPSPK